MSSDFLQGKIINIKNEFKELHLYINVLNSITSDYDKILDEYDYDAKNYIKQHKETIDNIHEVLDHITNIFKDKCSIIPLTKGPCQFLDYCISCSNHDCEDYMYCMTMCKQCIYFRKIKEQSKEKKLKQYYLDYIEKDAMVSVPQKVTNILTINNNVTINNIVQNYIYTKDLFFYVTIISTEANANEKLRYIFTYLMCGWSGNKIFPDQSTHSKALTFTVSAAKYDIVNENNKYTLRGLLRYQYKNNVKMTVKKLENMGNNKFNVKAILLPLYNNHKTQVSKPDIDFFIKTIINTENGSNIDDFYISDVN